MVSRKSPVTAERQRGGHKSGTYVYYHCTNGRGGCNKKGIREERLEESIEHLLGSITIHPKLKNIALGRMQQCIEEDLGKQELVFAKYQKSLEETEQRLNRLLDLRVRDVISDMEYLPKKQELQEAVKELTQALTLSQERFASLRTEIEKAFNFAVHAQEQFQLGSVEQKREISKALGIKYLLEEGKVFIELNPVLIPMQQLKTFEPQIVGSYTLNNDISDESILFGAGNGNLDEPLRTMIEVVRNGDGILLP